MQHFFRRLDIKMHIFIALNISKGSPESQISDNIQGQELRLPGKIHWFQFCVGGDVFPPDQVDEIGHMTVDPTFDSRIFFSRVLKHYQMMVLPSEKCRHTPIAILARR
jgi:hypothetical protein